MDDLGRSNKITLSFGTGDRNRNTITSVLSRRALSVPIMIALGWWTLCVMMFVVGWPIPYVQTNALLVMTMMISCAALLALGFRIATPQVLRVEEAGPRYPKVAIFGVVASVALLGPIVSTYSGFSLSEINDALEDQGAAFEQSTQRIREGTESRLWLLLVQSVLAPFTLIALPFVALRWFEQRRGFGLFMAALAVPLITSIMVGRDQQMGWAAISIGTAWLLSRFRRGLGIGGRNVFLIVGGAALFSVLFGLRKTSRGTTGIVCPPGSTECFGLAEERSVLEATIHSVSSYMSQGMEGLGRAFNTDWVFGGGLSHASAVNGLVNQILGKDEIATVTSQLWDVGWSPTWYWSTSITSFANDIPWLLIPLLFLFQGFVLGSSWTDALQSGNFLSTGVFVLTFLGVLFTPQNLQLAVSGPTYIGYIVLILLYLARQFVRRHNDKKRQIL